ncbi:MAG TPA: hypothetical protein VGP58_14960 [Pyrinomonadaceae bacterium]|nr:hypothetical protein [Pyrinomonadaceae bacterium]
MFEAARSEDWLRWNRPAARPDSKTKTENYRLTVSQAAPSDVSVSTHTEVGRLAEAFLSEVIGLEIRENCQKVLLPQYSFEITGNGKVKQSAFYFIIL